MTFHRSFLLRRIFVQLLLATSLWQSHPILLSAQQQAAPAASPDRQETQHISNQQPAASEDLTEEALKRLLLSKPLYLRACFLGDSLNFNEYGDILGHPSPGPYTLCGIEIEKIRLGKHKLELLGIRYGLHFLGALASEDPLSAIDRVRITPNKKQFRITIDREIIIKPKKIKDKPKRTDRLSPSPATTAPASSTAKTAEEDDVPSAAEQLRTSLAAAPASEKPADPNSVTTTTSPAHAAQLLRTALDRIFAPGLDERLQETMPEFWQLYYRAARSKTDDRPQNPAVLRQNAVDRKARLITSLEPPSNEFAQAANIAGMALYHVVIDASGKPTEIAVARPIGFGLDENAVAAIRTARFDPALKDGKPVPVLLDLIVQFRIFSNRTALTPSPTAADKPVRKEPDPASAPILPGPYSRQP